jgi:hypothetical protein
MLSPALDGALGVLNGSGCNPFIFNGILQMAGGENAGRAVISQKIKHLGWAGSAG